MVFFEIAQRILRIVIVVNDEFLILRIFTIKRNKYFNCFCLKKKLLKFFLRHFFNEIEVKNYILIFVYLETV